MKLAYITGATKGIGRSTAIAFANDGWDLILLSRNLDKLRDASNISIEEKKQSWLAMYTFNVVEGGYFDDNPSRHLGNY